MKQIFLLSLILCYSTICVYGDYEYEYDILKRYGLTHSHTYDFAEKAFNQMATYMSETIDTHKESIEMIKQSAIEFVTNTSNFYPNDGFNQIISDIDNKCESARNGADQLYEEYANKFISIYNEFFENTKNLPDLLYSQANNNDLNAQMDIVRLTDELAYNLNIQTNFNNARDQVIQLQSTLENELINYLYHTRYEVAYIVFTGAQYLPSTSNEDTTSSQETI